MRARSPSETRRRPRYGQNSGAARWLVSYADFITLLFAFFTSMYAISVTDAAKAERLVHSIRESFGDSLFELGSEEPGLLEQLRGVPIQTGEDLAATNRAVGSSCWASARASCPGKPGGRMGSTSARRKRGW